MVLITYLGKPELKAAFVGELVKHEALDAFVKGTYGCMNSHFSGCGIGCSLNSLNVLQGKSPMYDTGRHDRVPAELGWPLWLAYAEDTIFENLPDKLAKTWPRRLAEAIPVGVAVPDLVLAKMLRWQLLDARFGVVNATDKEDVKAVVRAMGALFDRTIAGETVPTHEWDEAARAARAAWDARAARAARDARAARAARAAWDAWDAWDAWAAWAAWAAWDAWAARAARAAWDARAAWTRDAFYPAMSEELLRLLRELSPPNEASVHA